MPAEKLYDLAMLYKKAKLWKQLYDTELFAIKLTNGEIGYCCVMGELGEHIALAVYVGRDGLDSYRRLFEAQAATSEMAQREQMLVQNCLQCSFENKDELSPFEVEEAQDYAKTRGIVYRGQHAFPQFKRYKPAHYPWFLQDAADEQILCEALLAALFVVEKLKTRPKAQFGFTDGAPFNRTVPLIEKKKDRFQLSTIELPDMQEISYPSPVVKDEILLAKLKKKTRQIWACEVVMFPNALDDEDADDNDDDIDLASTNAPVFPYMLLICDIKSEMVIQTDIVKDFTSDAEKMVTHFARTMLEQGVPSEIQVRDERTECLLRAFAKQVGIKLVRCADIPLLDDIEEDMLAHLDNDQQQDEDESEGVLNMLMEMDDEMLRSMPKDMRKQLLDLDKQGVLPVPLSVRVRRLFGS